MSASPGSVVVHFVADFSAVDAAIAARRASPPTFTATFTPGPGIGSPSTFSNPGTTFTPGPIFNNVASGNVASGNTGSFNSSTTNNSTLNSTVNNLQNVLNQLTATISNTTNRIRNTNIDNSIDNSVSNAFADNSVDNSQTIINNIRHGGTGGGAGGRGFNAFRLGRISRFGTVGFAIYEGIHLAEQTLESDETIRQTNRDFGSGSIGAGLKNAEEEVRFKRSLFGNQILGRIFREYPGFSPQSGNYFQRVGQRFSQLIHGDTLGKSQIQQENDALKGAQEAVADEASNTAGFAQFDRADARVRATRRAADIFSSSAGDVRARQTLTNQYLSQVDEGNNAVSNLRRRANLSTNTIAERDRLRGEATQLENQNTRQNAASLALTNAEIKDLGAKTGLTIQGITNQMTEAGISGQRFESASDRRSIYTANRDLQFRRTERESGLDAGLAAAGLVDAQFDAQEKRIDRANRSASFQILNSGFAAIDRASGHNFAAEGREAFGRFREQFDANRDPSRIGSIVGAYGLNVAALALGGAQSAGDLEHDLATQIAVASARLARDPQAAILASANASKYGLLKSINALPSFFQGPLRAGVDSLYGKLDSAALQPGRDAEERSSDAVRFDIARLRINNDQSVDPFVRQARAQSFGVIASVQQQQLARFTSGTEEGRAQDIKDLAKRGQTELQSQYLSRLNGITGVEVDPTRQALSGPGTEDVGAILNDIRDGINKLAAVPATLEDLRNIINKTLN